jgi:ribosomal protein L11 methyltransferase
VNYREFSFVLPQPEEQRDIFLAYVSEFAFDSFSETEEGFNAYTTEASVTAEMIQAALAENLEGMDYELSIREVEQKNWNEEWEKNFEPIVVDDQVLIRAPFHQDSGSFSHEIVIEPKMSFGTGHHSTTYLMVRAMLGIEHTGKNVLDMGCGTAVLAILAELLGAASVEAIDIDDWAYENSVENVGRNSCEKIRCYLGDASLLKDQRYDIILANINRNILIRDKAAYDNVLASGGYLLLSGFYATDVSILLDAFSDYICLHEYSKGGWACLVLQKH